MRISRATIACATRLSRKLAIERQEADLFLVELADDARADIGRAS